MPSGSKWTAYERVISRTQLSQNIYGIDLCFTIGVVSAHILAATLAKNAQSSSTSSRLSASEASSFTVRSLWEFSFALRTAAALLYNDGIALLRKYDRKLAHCLQEKYSRHALQATICPYKLLRGHASLSTAHPEATGRLLPMISQLSFLGEYRTVLPSCPDKISAFFNANLPSMQPAAPGNYLCTLVRSRAVCDTSLVLRERDLELVRYCRSLSVA